jgi:hypothetical protein
MTSQLILITEISAHAPVIPKIQQDPSRYLLAIDDTFVEKFGENIWGCYTWWDHKRKCYSFGQKILVVGLVDRKTQVFIPVAWEILHRDLSKSNIDPDHQKGWERALSLLQEIVNSGFPKLTVVADSWFANEEFFDLLTSNKFCHGSKT